MEKINIRNWLVKEYTQAGIKNLQIDAVMGAINDTLAKIKEKKLFDKRFNVSKNISVLMYESGTIEVHLTVKNVLSTYETFKPAEEEKQTFVVPFQAEEIVWNDCIATVEATSKEGAYQMVAKSIKESNPFADFNAEWNGINTVTDEVIETTKYTMEEIEVEDVKTKQEFDNDNVNTQVWIMREYDENYSPNSQVVLGVFTSYATAFQEAKKRYGFTLEGEYKGKWMIKRPIMNYCKGCETKVDIDEDGLCVKCGQSVYTGYELVGYLTLTETTINTMTEV